MAAVIAAIAAAFLAGAVALFREHRLQQRQLLVAARVTDASFRRAANGMRDSLSSNGWAPFNRLPGETSFSDAWDLHGGDLAGHLTWNEWLSVETAVSHYLAIRTMSQDDVPHVSRSVMDQAIERLGEGSEALRPYCIRRLSAWRPLRGRLSGSRRNS